MSDLPRGWIRTRLGAVCKIVSGSTPRSDEPRYWGGQIPWITPDDLSKHTSQMIAVGRRSISAEGYASCSAQMVPSGAVLYTSRAPIGYVAIASQPVCTNQGFKSLIPSEGLSSQYLYWYMRYATQEVRSRASGTTFEEISGRAVAEVPLVVAPRREQERIVAAIEEQFSCLDSAMHQFERVKRNLKRMRAAIHLRFDQAASKGISPQPLIEHAQFIVDGDHNPPKRFAQGIPYLTAKHVKNGRVTTEGATFVSAADFEVLRRRYDPRAGDVLVTCVGTLGEVAVVPDGLTFAADRNIAAIRPKPGVNPAFMASLLRSPQQREALVAGSGSTAQPHLYLKDLRALPLAVPDAARQVALLDELETGLAFISRTERFVNTSFVRMGLLRSGILTRAFAGKLVAQDPTDEPGVVLVERLATKRQPSNGPRAPRVRVPLAARTKVRP